MAWEVLRELVLRLHHGYEATPREARRRWWRVMLGGMVALQLLSVALVAAARWLVAAGTLGWEAEVVRWFDAQPVISFNTALWMEGIANGFVLWFVMLYAAGRAAWLHRPMLSLSILVGYTAAYFPIVTGWAVWDRERPTLIAGGIATPGGFFDSFPSGHMVQAAVAHGLLLFLWYRAAPRRLERAGIALVYLFLLAVVAFGRLRLGAHWPSDIVAGLVLGLAWLAVVVRALRGTGEVTRGAVL